MKQYITKSSKSKPVQKIINEALEILESIGIPIFSKTEKAMERMAVCFLAVAGVTKHWKDAQDNLKLETRQIISFINNNFEEKILSGKYYNLKRKDLRLLILVNLVVLKTEKKSFAFPFLHLSYSLNSEFKNLIAVYKTPQWNTTLKDFNKNRPNLSEILARKRNIEKFPVKLPVNFSLGKHNKIQKEIIEQFLPRFGNDCTVLYIGDTSNKSLYKNTEELSKLNFFELSHNVLPDIVAFSKKKNWLYLFEAVHSSGPMNEIRVMQLKEALANCKAELIFVTAFLTKAEFRKWMLDIAWETEVWTADNPDHLVHFNGNKFLGPYSK